MIKDTGYYSTQSVESTLKELTVKQSDGLSTQEVAHRQNEYGFNKLPTDKQAKPFKILLRQFRAVIVWIMIVAATLSFAFSHPIDGWVILALIITNILLGFFQEYRAERAIGALQDLLVTHVKVRRDGQMQLITPEDLVPGDILVLDEGDKIPADAKVISSKNLQTIEAALTGESFPTDKTNHTLKQTRAITEQTNMVFMGTLVSRGVAEAVVVATGISTQFGKIAENLQTITELPDHYEKRTKKLSSQMVVVALSSAAITFLVGFFIRHFELYEMIIYTIATLVSALPESLPIILVLVLAVGAQKMAKRNAIVRRLPATETLGVVSIIMTDKTGTLTRNEMRAERILFPDQPIIEVNSSGSEDTIERLLTQNDKPLVFDKHVQLEKILTIAALCNNLTQWVDSSDTGKLTNENSVGDPTEYALIKLAIDTGLYDKTYSKLPEKIDDLPFVQELRLRASLVRSSADTTEEKEVFVIGAPEAIIERCSTYLHNNKEHKWHAHEKEAFIKQTHQLTDQAMRVIACAYVSVSPLQKRVNKSDLQNLVFVGCVGLFDPPRPEVKAAIATALAAGIKVVMATGDHPKTALAVAKQIGLLPETADENNLLTGVQIAELSDVDLSDQLKTKTILARLSPSTKLRIAKIFQSQGHIVAMTGDGVNDAPALKQADVGIAMGKKGTDVAREASEIVLADDNFSSIVSAIEEGRVQFSNVRRTSYFLIATNVAESLGLLFALLLGFPLPLLPLQILWLNIITGGVTDIALTTEHAHKDVMKVGPRNPSENILIANFIPLFSTLVLSMVVILLSVFLYFLPEGVEKARTAAFAVLSLTQLFNMFTMRSLHQSVFEIGIFSNKAVNIVFFISLSLMLGVMYIPQLQHTFNFVSLSAYEFTAIALISLGVFIAAEVVKKLKPAGTTYKQPLAIDS